MKNKFEYDIIIIGGGSAGLTAAIGSSQIGAKTLLIEKEKVGGDCTHFGCVPSKTLINLSKKSIKLKEALKITQSKINKIYEKETPKELEKYNLKTIIGSPKFINKNTISINNKEITSNYFIIATGSRTFIPKIENIENVKYLTNKEIFIESLNSLSKKTNPSLTIIGAGPIGCELSQALNKFNIKINLINNSEHILQREEENASKIIQDIFLKEKINIFNNSQILQVSQDNKNKTTTIKDTKTNKIIKIQSDEILIATGRTPNIENLGLENINIKFDNRGIFINEKTQTNIKNIYAIGDVTQTKEKFTHYANHMGKIAITNIIFKIPSKLDTINPRVTFTSPQIASVGVNSKEIKSDFELIKKYNEIDRAITDEKEEGFIKIIVNKKGYIKGATIIGEQAGELIGEVTLAIKNKIKITKLSNTIHPYPTYAYALRNTADQYLGQKFNSNKKNILKKIFNLRGN